MDEPRIRAAAADDVSAITEIVDRAYRHHIACMGKPPGPMLDDYAARVLEGPRPCTGTSFSRSMTEQNSSKS